MTIKKTTLYALMILTFVLIPAAFAGRVDLTSYYPSPYGEYKNLKSTEDSYFATTSGNVGIGTTSPATKLEVNGNITAPQQTMFSVRKSATQSNIAVGSSVTIVFNSEIFDTTGNFSSNTFTAPVTGKYLFTGVIRLNAIDSAATYYEMTLVTSNRSYDIGIINSTVLGGDPSWWTFPFSILADMDTNDTAYITIYQYGGAQQTDIEGNASYGTAWQGVLIA